MIPGRSMEGTSVISAAPVTATAAQPLDVPSVTRHRRWIRNLLSFTLLLAAFYVAYRYGMAFSQAVPSPFWFPDSVLLCALLLVPVRWWWLVLLATLPIRMTTGGAHELPAWFLLATAPGSVRWLGAWLHRFLAGMLGIK